MGAKTSKTATEAPIAPPAKANNAPPAKANNAPPAKANSAPATPLPRLQRSDGTIYSSVTSDESTKKVKYPDGSEKWGPYKYERYPGWFGSTIQKVPGYVDGIPILTGCNEIPTYLTGLGSSTFMVRKNSPACYDSSFMATGKFSLNPEEYYVFVNDKRFYTEALLGFTYPKWGGKTRRHKSVGRKNTLKRARRV